MFSHEGRISVFNKVDGTPLWNKTVDEGRPGWGYASSPLIEGDLVIVNVGGAAYAVDKNSPHDVVWSNSGSAGYASPYAFDNGSQRTVVIFGGTYASGVDPSDGTVLWRFNWGQGMADPIIKGDMMWVSRDYGKGAGLGALERNASAALLFYCSTVL